MCACVWQESVQQVGKRKIIFNVHMSFLIGMHPWCMVHAMGMCLGMHAVHPLFACSYLWDYTLESRACIPVERSYS